ncbi:MAG: hypothetical protein CL663_07690 [Bacteroidetes bacterium]|nr:hypothetical protein [Bacteroidota bacterium]
MIQNEPKDQDKTIVPPALAFLASIKVLEKQFTPALSSPFCRACTLILGIINPLKMDFTFAQFSNQNS